MNITTSIQNLWTGLKILTLGTILCGLIAPAVFISEDGIPTGPSMFSMDEYGDPLLTSAENTPVVGFVDLAGTIVSDGQGGGLLSEGGIITPDSVRQALSPFFKDDSITAVFIRFSSPGGMVAPSDEIAKMIQRLSQKKKVYIYTPDILASGGYYAAAGAHRIMAEPQAEVGSIGVILEMPNVSELANKLGVTMTTLTTGKLKDTGNPFRSMKAEENAYLQDTMHKSLALFEKHITQSRPILAEQDRAVLFSGQTWLAQDAVKLGLIDAEGDFHDMIQLIKKENGWTDIILASRYEERDILTEIESLIGLGTLSAQSRPIVQLLAPLFQQARR